GTSVARGRFVASTSRPLGPGRSGARNRPERRQAARGERGRFSVGPPPERELESRSIIAKGYADTAKGHARLDAGEIGPARATRAAALAGDANAWLVVRLENTRGALAAAAAQRDHAVA